MIKEIEEDKSQNSILSKEKNNDEEIKSKKSNDTEKKEKSLLKEEKEKNEIDKELNDSKKENEEEEKKSIKEDKFQNSILSKENNNDDEEIKSINTKKKEKREKRLIKEEEDKKEIDKELNDLEKEKDEEEKKSKSKKESEKELESSDLSENSQSAKQGIKNFNQFKNIIHKKMKKDSEEKKIKDEMDKNLANYLKLSYYIEEKKIRNALMQNEVEKKEIDKPTEARLIKRIKELDKEIIPRNKKYFYSGVQIITLTDINNRENVKKSKNKKIQQGLSNMTIKKTEKISNEELREMPEILDNVIKKRGIDKKNYAKNESTFIDNIVTPKDTLTPTTDGDDDCIIF